MYYVCRLHRSYFIVKVFSVGIGLKLVLSAANIISSVMSVCVFVIVRLQANVCGLYRPHYLCTYVVSGQYVAHTHVLYLL